MLKKGRAGRKVLYIVTVAGRPTISEALGLRGTLITNVMFDLLPGNQYTTQHMRV